MWKPSPPVTDVQRAGPRAVLTGELCCLWFRLCLVKQPHQGPVFPYIFSTVAQGTRCGGVQLLPGPLPPLGPQTLLLPRKPLLTTEDPQRQRRCRPGGSRVPPDRLGLLTSLFHLSFLCLFLDSLSPFSGSGIMSCLLETSFQQFALCLHAQVRSLSIISDSAVLLILHQLGLSVLSS